MNGCKYFSILRKPLSNTKLLQEKTMLQILKGLVYNILNLLHFWRILKLTTRVIHCQKVALGLPGTIRGLNFGPLTQNIKLCSANTGNYVSNAYFTYQFS